MHHLVASNGSPGRWVGVESKARFDPPFDETMILLDNIVQVSAWPSLARLGQHSVSDQIANGSDVRSVLIHIDDARRSDLRLA